MATGNLRPRSRCALLQALGLFAAVAWSAPLEAAPATALSVSDIHFNPFYDPTLVERLAAASPGDWHAIFATSSSSSLGDYGKEETNHNLLASILRDMRQRGEGGDAAGYLRISPGVSPQFGNNPGYQRLSYDRNDFSLDDVQVFYLDLASGQRDGAAGWDLEYKFNHAYGIDEIDPQSLQRSVSCILVDPAVRAAWMGY